jgi:type IV secretory pathway VirB2 component (pilin)
MTSKTMERWAVVLAVMVVGLCVLVAPDAAWAQLDRITSKAAEIQEAIITVMRTLFIIAAAIIGYLWAKGSHEARDRTEKLLVGLAIAFGATELVNYFAG